MRSPTSVKGKQQAAAASASEKRAMLHAPGITGNMHGSQRPKNYVESSITRGVAKWARAYLPGYTLVDLEPALALVKKHPDQASPGYSMAKNTRQRLEMEINRQRALPKQAA